VWQRLPLPKNRGYVLQTQSAKTTCFSFERLNPSLVLKPSAGEHRCSAFITSDLTVVPLLYHGWCFRTIAVISVSGLVALEPSAERDLSMGSSKPSWGTLGSQQLLQDQTASSAKDRNINDIFQSVRQYFRNKFNGKRPELSAKRVQEWIDDPQQTLKQHMDNHERYWLPRKLANRQHPQR